MKVKISSNEWYPVYEIDDIGSEYSFGTECEIPDGVLSKIKTAFDLFEDAQECLADFLEKAEK